MTLFDSSPLGTVQSQHYRYGLLGLSLLWVALTVLLIVFWNWPVERHVNRFFDAIEAQDFPKAFSIWNNDFGWQQHSQTYEQAGYPYGRFLADWSASGDYGVIKSHKILYVTSRQGNSVLVVVEVNGRERPLTVLSIAKKGHTMGFSPFEFKKQKDLLGMTYWQISYR